MSSGRSRRKASRAWLRISGSILRDQIACILRFAFRRPARQDLDLTRLLGQMPPLGAVKLIDYDEDAWTARRSEALQKIQDVVRRTR